MSKPISQDEERKAFIQHLMGIAEYWASVSSTGEITKPTPERLRQAYGMVHSFLVLLDGGSGMMPSYLLIPNPHPEDKDYHIQQGEDYHRQPTDEERLVLEKFDIGGALHEEYHSKWSKERK